MFKPFKLKLVGIFLEIVPMFVAICASSGAHAHFRAYLRDGAIPNKILLSVLYNEHWNYPKEYAYQL